MKNNALGSVRCFETMLDSATNPRAKSSWRKALANIYDVVLPPDVPFKAGGRSWMVPSGFVHEAYGSPMQMKRDAAFIRAHPIDEISVFRLTEGRLEAEYGGPVVRLEAGDLVMLDYARPIFTRSERFRSQSVTARRDTAPGSTHLVTRHGSVLKKSSPLGKLLGRQLDALVAGMDDLAPADADVVFASFIDLAIRVWPTPDKAEQTIPLADRAMALIAAELRNPALGPVFLAARLNVSRTALYTAFAERGGISALIQSMRLDASLKVLIAERRHPGLVSNVAKHFGFKSLAHFSRAFSERFGRLPSEVMTLTNERVGGRTFSAWLEAKGHDPTKESIQMWLDGV